MTGGVLVGCTGRGPLHLLLGKIRLGMDAGKWGVPLAQLPNFNPEVDWLTVRERFDKAIWPKFAPVKGRTAEWVPKATLETGLFQKSRWYYVLLDKEPESLKLDFSEEDRQRLGAYPGNWPFGLADFTDLRWWPAEKLPEPLLAGIKQIVKRLLV